MWTKVTFTFKSLQTFSYYTVTKYGNTGTAAGFGTPTIAINSTTGKPSGSITASGSNTSKKFAFTFNMRPPEWKTGTDMSSGGTSTTYKDSNTIVGDVYLNKNTGQTFVCTAVTSSNSTWVESINISTSASADDLKDTKRYFSTLAANPSGSEQVVTFTETNSTYYKYSDWTSNTYDYRVRFLSSNPSVQPIDSNIIVDSSNKMTATITFCSIHSDSVRVCMEIIKKNVA